MHRPGYAAITFRQAHDYHPNRRASPPLCQFQIILLANNRHQSCAWATCPGWLPESALLAGDNLLIASPAPQPLRHRATTMCVVVAVECAKMNSHSVHNKVSQVRFAITLNIVSKFPSNSYSSECWTVCVETIHFTWRVYIHYLVMLRDTEMWQYTASGEHFERS